jgi:TonB-dependent receptor
LDGETNISRWFKVKTGAFYTRKDRDFNEFRYQLENNGTDPDVDGFISFREASGNYEGYFSPENTGVIGNDGNGNNLLGITYRDQTRPQNSYAGFEQVSAFYLMGIFDLTNNFKAFAGARVEKTDFSVKSSAVNAQKGEIDVTDVLPSLNVIYSLNEKSNIRLSASQTLARPNIRELAPFASFDLLGGFPIVGNPEITRTNVTNLDFRYEIFPKSTELVAVSAFYKDFKNPIVMELDVASDQPQYQYINTNSGRLFGVELEFRKGLGFISSRFDNFKFSTNFTYISSRVDLSDNELETRRRLDPSIKAFRSFPSQSPYIVNFMLIYENQETGWDGNIYANVFGPRLTANGAGAAPDIFEMYGKLDGNGQLQSETPVPDLNIKVRKTFMNGFSAALSVNNIMDYSIIQYQEDNGEYFINSALNPGRTVSLSFTYSIN